MCMFNVSLGVVYSWILVPLSPSSGEVTYMRHTCRTGDRTWLLVVAPGVAWHRRCSSWHLWGSLTLLLYIYIFAHYPTMGKIMCKQLWSIQIYLIIYFCVLFSLFFYFSFHFIGVKWYTFNCDTSVVPFLWGSQTVRFVILHLECSTQNFGGEGVCVMWWNYCHLFSLFTHLVLLLILHNYPFKPFIIIIQMFN